VRPWTSTASKSSETGWRQTTVSLGSTNNPRSHRTAWSASTNDDSTLRLSNQRTLRSWYENGDFSLHYHEDHEDGVFDHRWDRHPSAHNQRDHVHPGPNAPTPGDDTSQPVDWRDVLSGSSPRLNNASRRSGRTDCRPAYSDAFQNAMDVGTKPGTEIELNVPFVEWSEREVVECGSEFGDRHSTYTCASLTRVDAVGSANLTSTTL